MDLTKMGLIQLQNPSHPTGLLQKANQMRLAGTLCDVVIMVDNQEFHAHRTVLACTSKMFEILFHRNSQHYTLDFLSPKTFQQILEYAYTATLQAKVEDLDDLLYAAEILEIEYLEEQCLKILETIQASDENDTEVNMTDGGTEEEEDRKSRYIKNLFISKHSSEESSYGNMASQSLTGAMVEQSPSVSTSFGLSAMSPTKAAVDSLMTIGQSLLQGSLQQNASEDLHSTSSRHPSLSEVKTEVMQVEEASSHESPRTAESSTSGGDKSDDKSKEGPGTPTRSSVITSARELHYARDENPEQPLELGQGVSVGPEHSISQSEKHLSIYSVLPNHKTDSMLSMPSSMTSALHMQPALAVSMDFSAYGGLLPQGFIQRELFSKLGELAAGMKTENRAIGEQCSVCGAELPDNETVEQHRKLHSGMKTYGCELCGKRFLDSLRLRMHLLAHSAGAKAFVCDQCGTQFSKEDALETHRQTHTGTDMAVFCLLCGKRFQTQTALQQHMEVHAGVRSYICSECNRTFPSHTALKRHLRSHTGDHPYECEFCGSCFRDESTLKGHKRIHTGEKPYECNGCGKKFSLKHQLETHYRVHTGEKPFECKLCHQRSRDYSAMIKHLRTHNGASPYQCTICLEYCPSLSAMQKHMKGHKPEEIPTDWRIEKTYLYLCYV
ncbi:zinc finger and BTB domain-containing protein 16 isoform X1 [Chelonoidis abingdonii]|uniref:Zinc finger and BTB domain containing 16 n=1 Tax=Chelonoidis abingdonii TaxID=106734 RepID=A0A8C0GSR2_CHEAB|nr:zinc finger and BTB domain-containing protein 16 [Chelonoidis abingdonii]XP_032652011.1 zinc finger and BTB domain-containing protein 16 [Chelonoidis abingdonii]XP_032652012.1 zinc finger and BTB domain-containing protein 16 [Chelonoidis abingdonii]XP_032652013.1 zinc finger and BTB domain-containing protein 16 [Chelonoidis abingdonii]